MVSDRNLEVPMLASEVSRKASIPDDRDKSETTNYPHRSVEVIAFPGDSITSTVCMESGRLGLTPFGANDTTNLGLTSFMYVLHRLHAS